MEGNVVIEYNYDPWGRITYNYLGEGNGAEDEEFLKLFTAIFCPLTYRGYNYDFTTGLYYLQSRYYNPDWGRFLNVDDTSILLASQGTTHGANLFAYCENNPVNKVDYTGKYTRTIDLSEVGLYVGSLKVTIEILNKIDSYNNYLKYDLCDFMYRVVKDKAFFIFNRCPYIVTNIAFYDSKEKKFYIIKSIISETSYWNQRTDDVKDDIDDTLHKHAPVFFEGSLSEIIDDYDDVPMVEGFMNLGGDIFNYGVSRLLIDTMHPMPLQFRSVYKKNPNSQLIVGFKKNEIKNKWLVKANVDDLLIPTIFDAVKAVY